MMRHDPFLFKDYPRWDPRRVIPTLYARMQELYARACFEAYELPRRTHVDLPKVPDFDEEDTAVTAMQMRYLQHAAQHSIDTVTDGVVVEVGCYRGVTTRVLANAVYPKTVIAVDPFIGWGGARQDYSIFKQRIGDLSNVHHERKTSGEAARNWQHGSLSFVFIDAVHDYWNTTHDLSAWNSLLTAGGFLAAHDTDQIRFAGTRRAVYKMKQGEQFDLFAHVDNLVILKKTMADDTAK